VAAASSAAGNGASARANQGFRLSRAAPRRWRQRPHGVGGYHAHPPTGAPGVEVVDPCLLRANKYLPAWHQFISLAQRSKPHIVRFLLIANRCRIERRSRSDSVHQFSWSFPWNSANRDWMIAGSPTGLIVCWRVRLSRPATSVTCPFYPQSFAVMSQRRDR
jgi:hypothetical protein